MQVRAVITRCSVPVVVSVLGTAPGVFVSVITAVGLLMNRRVCGRLVMDRPIPRQARHGLTRRGGVADEQSNGETTAEP